MYRKLRITAPRKNRTLQLINTIANAKNNDEIINASLHIIDYFLDVKINPVMIIRVLVAKQSCVKIIYQLKNTRRVLFAGENNDGIFRIEEDVCCPRCNEMECKCTCAAKWEHKFNEVKNFLSTKANFSVLHLKALYKMNTQNAKFFEEHTVDEAIRELLN